MTTRNCNRFDRAILALDNQCDRCIAAYPNDRLRVLAAAERRPVADDRRAKLMDFILDAESGEEKKEYGFASGGNRFFVEYDGDRIGFDEFVRLVDEINAIITANQDWSAARPVGIVGLMCYLGIWRPTPFLQTRLQLVSLRPKTPADIALIGDGSLVTVEMTLAHGVFHSLRATNNWLIAPGDSLELPATVNPAVDLLPNWKDSRGHRERAAG
jgi:hypothetical protein